jgi:hypothetical protein
MPAYTRIKRRCVSLGLIAATSMVPLSVASSASAASGGNEALQFCRSISRFYEGNITGPCVSYFRSHDNNARATTVYFCKTFFVPEGSFATVGKCIKRTGRLS